MPWSPIDKCDFTGGSNDTPEQLYFIYCAIAQLYWQGKKLPEPATEATVEVADLDNAAGDIVTAAGEWRSASVTNIVNADGTVAGGTLAPGQTMNFGGEVAPWLNQILPDIAGNATGTKFSITRIK